MAEIDAVALLIAIPVVLTLCCVTCGIGIGVFCCRKFRKKQNPGMILALPTTVPPQNYPHIVPHQPLNHNVPIGPSHNVPEEPAPAYESLQRDRQDPPPHTPSSQPEQQREEDTDESYDYIPTDERDMPTRGQRVNPRSRSRIPLPEPPAECEQLHRLPPDQYLTVNNDNNEDGITNSGYLTPIEQSEDAGGYLAPTDSTSPTCLPLENDGESRSHVASENTDGYLAPASNSQDYDDASSGVKL